jgi:mannose-1-phosphate guanylyltransferase
MKAVILAGGPGTRLRPLTDSIPKCMVPIDDRPVLEHNLDWLRGYGITDIAINLHHLPDAVRGHFSNGERFGVNISYLYEPELLGTAGTVRALRGWLGIDEPFLVVYGDNLIRCDVHGLRSTHERSGAAVTVALHWRDDVSSSGVATMTPSGRVARFAEKPAPEAVTSNWVNAGVMLGGAELLDCIGPPPIDFGRDVLPPLSQAGRVQGYIMGEGESLFWIDRPKDLERTRARWTASPMGRGD